jgi:nicotinamide-nucleotide amidase
MHVSRPRRLDLRVADALRHSGLTIAVAESCTGGLIGHRLTEVSGSSDYFLLGVVSYSNAAKMSVLGVPREVIEGHGAVSEQCVRAMAEGVRRISGAGVALAVSGVAGPSGGTTDKPVGTVHIALAHAGGSLAEHHLFRQDRSGNKRASADAALDLLLRFLDGQGQ